MAGTGFSFGTSASFGFSNRSTTSSAPSFGFGFGTTSSTTTFGASSLFGTSSLAGTTASTTTSPFGASPLFGPSSGAAPAANLFGSSSSGTNLFGLGSSPAPNIFVSSSGGAPTSGLSRSSLGAGQTASPFGSLASTAAPAFPSPSSAFGTSTLFGSPAPSSTTSSNFSFLKNTTSSAASASAPTSASSSPGFSFGTTGSQSSAPTPSLSSAPASKPVTFGTTASAPFSTVTTTTTANASAPAAASASSAGTGSISVLMFPASSGTSSSASAASVASASAPSSGNILSYAECCSDSASIHLGVGLGGDGVQSEGEQVSDRVKTLTDQMAEPEFIPSVSLVVKDEEEKGDGIIKEGDVVDGVSACIAPATSQTVSKEMTSFTAQVHSYTTAEVSCGEVCSPVEDNQGLKYEATSVAKKQTTKEVDNDTSENSSSESEVFDGNELGYPFCGSLIAIEFPPCADFKQLNLSPQNSLSPRKAHLIKKTFRKYGDITRGSILKSIEAKTAFLQLVAGVLEQLHTHSLDTIGSHEIQVIQKWTDDAAAVGFHVEWLQHRIKKIVTISKYQHSLMRLNEISEQINGAKIALLEMELQEMILKKEVDSMKAEMDREEICRSNLCEGLF